MKFSEINVGDTATIETAISKIEEREGKNGKKYCVLSCMDGTDTVNVNAWCEREKLLITEPCVICAEIVKKPFQNSFSYVLNSYKPGSGNFNDFIPHAPIMADEEMHYIRSVIFRMTNPSLKRVTEALFSEHSKEFKEAPAAKGVHHNYRNGLLYHTERMLKMGMKVADVYERVDRDLLCAGIILHDIGKIYELEMDPTGTVTYTVDGKLFGHLLIGVQLINEKAKVLGLEKDESIRLLEHLVASHHGKLEYGAIAQPVILEAMLLNQIDMIDANTWQFEKITDELKEGEFSNRIYSLDNTFVYHRPEKKAD